MPYSETALTDKLNNTQIQNTYCRLDMAAISLGFRKSESLTMTVELAINTKTCMRAKMPKTDIKPNWLPLTNAPYYVMRKYDYSMRRAVEFLADALLRHPEFALTCHVYKTQTRRTEYVPRAGEIRMQILERFKNCVTENGRVGYGSGLFIDMSELPALCQAEGLVIPPMFHDHVRICPAEPDIPLSDAARMQIRDGLRIAGHVLAPDVEARLFVEIENAANWYLRAPLLNYGLPDKITARKYAKRLEAAAVTLRDLLTDMQIPERGQSAMYSEFRKMLREWGINHFDFEQSLARVALAAEELRLRVDERMPGRGKPRDDAAELLACEIANALRHAEFTPTAYDDGPFEGYILPAVLEFVGAGAAGGRLHELARLAARSRPDDDG